jgi:hypothetical protein
MEVGDPAGLVSPDVCEKTTEKILFPPAVDRRRASGDDEEEQGRWAKNGVCPTRRCRNYIGKEGMSSRTPCMGALHQMQCMQGVPEPGLQRRHQYQMMCGAEDETRGAEAIQLCSAVSDARSVQREAGIDSRRPVDKDWDVSAGGYSFNPHVRWAVFVSLIRCKKTALYGQGFSGAFVFAQVSLQAWIRSLPVS